MFDYLRLDLFNSNEEKFSLKAELKSLKEKLFATKNSLSLISKENSCLSLSNKIFLCEKEKSKEHDNNIQFTINNWAHSHFNTTRIINAQNPDQCKKILGGDTGDAVSLFKKIKFEQYFYNGNDLEKDFQTRFFSTYYINYTLIDKHCITDSNGNTKCISRLSAIDPSQQPPQHGYVAFNQNLA